MKIFKRIGLVLLILICFGMIFCGLIYRNLVTYKSIGERTSFTVLEPKLLKYINSNGELREPDVHDIIRRSLQLTSGKLTFTSGENEKDPNQLITSKEANCIGYAAFFATVCNALLDNYSLHDWTARPRIGQIYFLGTNIHPYFKSAFFRDHDFVIIENRATGEILAVDPSLNDYTRIGFVTFHK